MVQRQRDLWFITSWQAEALTPIIRRQLLYHRQMLKRMDALRFSQQDRFYLQVMDCVDALQSVLDTLHLLSARHGMGFGPEVTEKWDKERPP